MEERKACALGCVRGQGRCPRAPVARLAGALGPGSCVVASASRLCRFSVLLRHERPVCFVVATPGCGGGLSRTGGARSSSPGPRTLLRALLSSPSPHLDTAAPPAGACDSQVSCFRVLAEAPLLSRFLSETLV